MRHNSGIEKVVIWGCHIKIGLFHMENPTLVSGNGTGVANPHNLGSVRSFLHEIGLALRVKWPGIERREDVGCHFVSAQQSQHEERGHDLEQPRGAGLESVGLHCGIQLVSSQTGSMEMVMPAEGQPAFHGKSALPSLAVLI